MALVAHPEYATYVVIDVKLSSYDGKKTRMSGEFKSGNDNYTYERLMWEKDMAKDRSDEIADYLFNGNENGRKKADTIHDYVVGILEYDDSYSPASYTAYGAFTSGKAVCQGYSAVFNMLCNSAGVHSLAVANDSHMWNVVYVDGKFYHYDTTFDDTGSDKEKYKGVEESEFVTDERHRGYVLPDADDFI